MKLRDAAVDAAGLGGFALVVYGASLIYPPAAFIVAGVGLLAFAVKAATRAENPEV